MYGDPWKLKYFNFSDFAKSSSTEFIGRQWLYQEMEHALEHTSKRGVLITGSSGSGKSAFLSHLLCSKTSSRFIHNRILGYHFCMHDNKKTQDGAAFVRNIANMIAWKISRYRERILTNSFVRRVLYEDCPQDPEWCFEHAVVTPLKTLHPKPSVPWYIVVDALDECSNEKAEIVNIIKFKSRKLPRWLKLIVSSRNVSTVVAGVDGLQRVDLRLDDKRNLEDVNTYLTLKMFSLKESITETIKTSLAIMDNDTPTQKIVSSLAEKGDGNFLYVKVMLDLWLSSAENFKWESLPKALDSTYQVYFERKYGNPESFQPLREIFEVLVAAYTPLTVLDMYSLFRFDKPTLDLEYEFLPKLDQVSLFLCHGSRDDLIRIHHASLSEWLTSKNNKGKIYYVKKQNGHKRLAKYYLKNAEENHSPLKPEEAFHLASHIVEGGLDKFLEQRFLSLPSECINTTDSVTQTTALHYSARSYNTNVTNLLVHHFSDVDCPDNNQRTPSFIASTTGHVGILMVLFERGANLHLTAANLDVESASHSQDPVTECKRKRCGYSLLHTAAYEGNVDVVKYLLQHKVSISRPTGVNNTPIQLAAANGHLETVMTLKNAGGILDEFLLHHSAAGGHRHVVQYLLGEGVKDTCIQNTLSSMPLSQEDKELKATKIYLYDNRHLYLRETALHAAVRRGHVSVIELLMREDQSAINCTNSVGRHPQHEAVLLKNYNTLKVLLQSGANATVHCDTGISNIQSETFVPGKFENNRCPCGFSPLHIAAMHGHHSIAVLLIEYKADVNAGDCNGSTPLHVASCQGMSSLITLLINSRADINVRSLNGSTPLHSAAACHATGVFYSLIYLGCDYLATDSEGMTALHYVVKDVNVINFEEYLVDLYVNKPKDWIENLSSTSRRESINNLYFEYPWLHTLVEIIKSVAITERAGLFSLLEIIDNRNQSVFDVLEEKTNASSLLVGSNRIGGLPLVLSLTPFMFAYDFTHSELIKFHIKPSEPDLIPVSLTRVISRAFASIFTNLNCSSLVNFIRLHKVYALNTALQAGFDINCYDDVSGLSPLQVYLRTGGRHVSKVLVKHNVELKIKCGDSFESSVFHLVSYHKLHYLHYLYDFLRGSDNWQKYLQTENALFDYFLDTYEERNNNGIVESVRSGDGPLTKAIMSHPNGTKVVDECFDAEGFNVLHRAAQGANLVAIRKFLSWGANHSSETESGFTPLWLSIIHAVKYRPYLNLERSSVLTALEVELASFSASEILDHILRNGTLDVGCNKSHSNLTLYHVAASRGLWQFIAHLLSSDRITGIDVNCPNKDGITPMYLAKIIGGDTCERYGPWCRVVDVIKSYGGTLQYPTLEAEYFLIFNIFFGKNPSSLFLELTEDEIMALRENCGRDECQKYKAENIDLFRTSDEVDRVHSGYQKMVDKCSSFGSECSTDVKTKLPHFTFVLSILGEQLCRKFHFIFLRNNFLNFLNNEIERLKKLLYTATRPHAEMACTRSPRDRSHQVDDVIDMCSKFHKQDLETVVHDFYRTYKQNLEWVMESSDEVKSSMAFNGKLPRFLVKMKSALHSYDTTLNCDWQTIANKYLQLSFQVRNLNYWQQAVYETLTVPSISEFLSQRLTNVILQPSEESRKLVLKLASRQPTETFNYLKILRFTKPPFWHETFYGQGNFG